MPVRHHGRMAAIMDWDRLAEYARERRVELGMTQEDARARGGPSTATMRLIEGALQQSYQPATLRDLEKALLWEPGSARRILAGGDPVPVTASEPTLLHRNGAVFPPMTRRMATETEPHFREIAGRVEVAAAAEARRRSEEEGRVVTPEDVIMAVPAGEVVFPGSRRDRERWDTLASKGFTTWQIAQGLAALAALGEGSESEAAVLRGVKAHLRRTDRNRLVTMRRIFTKGTAINA